MNRNLKLVISVGLLLGFSFLFAAAADTSLSTIANNVRKNLMAVANLIMGIAFLAGIAFFLTGLVKFKAHKDNPTQVPLSAPLVMIAISACLMFLPSLISVAGQTVFGGTQTSAQGALKETADTNLFSSGSN